jgi:hypothetical protein
VQDQIDVIERDDARKPLSEILNERGDITV